MEDIREKVVGNVTIIRNSQYHQLESDKVTVETGVTARVFGRIKDLHLKPGSVLYLHGTITGNIINEGGILNVYDSFN